MSKIITITIDTSNAAFETGEALESANIIRYAAEMVERHMEQSGDFMSYTLRDLNGNRVGVVIAADRP